MQKIDDIVFIKGDTLAFVLTVRDEAESLKNVEFSVRYADVPVLQRKLGEGIYEVDARPYNDEYRYRVQIQPEETIFLMENIRYTYDLVIETQDEKKTVAYGFFVVLPSISGDIDDSKHADQANVLQNAIIAFELDPIATQLIGDLGVLQTPFKGNIVGAVNDLEEGKVSKIEPNLQTEARIVIDAINELNSDTSTIATRIEDLKAEVQRLEDRVALNIQKVTQNDKTIRDHAQSLKDNADSIEIVKASAFRSSAIALPIPSSASGKGISNDDVWYMEDVPYFISYEVSLKFTSEGWVDHKWGSSAKPQSGGYVFKYGDEYFSTRRVEECFKLQGNTWIPITVVFPPDLDFNMRPSGFFTLDGVETLYVNQFFTQGETKSKVFVFRENAWVLYEKDVLAGLPDQLTPKMRSLVFFDGERPYYLNGEASLVWNGNAWEQVNWTGDIPTSSAYKLLFKKNGRLYGGFDNKLSVLIKNRWYSSNFLQTPRFFNNFWVYQNSMYTMLGRFQGDTTKITFYEDEQ